MIVRHKNHFNFGYNPIVDIYRHENMLMDFGIFKLGKGQKVVSEEDKERFFLLISGTVELEFNTNKIIIERVSCFDEMPWCLHVPANVVVGISCLKEGTELSVHKTINIKRFEAKIVTPEDIRSEQRSIRSLQDTATRLVRTIIDKTNRQDSNLVIGETINFPGRWSGYPPHYHPQPEIYFYKFSRENGFGYAEVGDQVYKIKNNDTVLIEPGAIHPQVSAPGYAMYYLWAIRHLENLPYSEPIFVPEHLWMTNDNASVSTESGKDRCIEF